MSQHSTILAPSNHLQIKLIEFINLSSTTFFIFYFLFYLFFIFFIFYFSDQPSSSSFSVSPRTQAVTPTNSSLHYRLHSNLHYHRHVRSQLRRRCLRWQKAITCWDDDDEEHGNEIKAGGQLRLLLPHDLLSSSCRSDLDRPITHSDLFFLCSLSLFFVVRSFLCSSSSNRWFFAVRSLVLLQVCSSSVLQVCSSSSILLWF